MRKITSALLICAFALSACQRTGHVSSKALSSIHLVDQHGMTQTLSGKERLKTYESVDFTSPQPYQKVARQYKDRNGENYGVITSYYPNGQIMQLLHTRLGNAYGTYKEWFEDGQLHLEIQVIGGRGDLTEQAQNSWIFDGLSYSWNQEGFLEASIPYNKGNKEGLAHWYHPNGQIWQVMEYHRDQLDGDHKTYDPKGQLICYNRYCNGTLDGTQVRYWSHGVQAAKEVFLKGKLQNADYWDWEGNLLEKNVRNGEGWKLVFAKDYVVSEQQISSGVLCGEVRTFDSEGNLLNKHSIKDGYKHGDEIDYYLLEEASFSGKKRKKPLKKLQVHWVQGQLKGMCQTWYPDGHIESQREVWGEKNHGSYVSYYPNGDLRMIEEYRHGKLNKGKYWRIGDRVEVSTVDEGKGVATLHDDEGNFLQEIRYVEGRPLVELEKR